MESDLHRMESAQGSAFFQLGVTMKAASSTRWIRMGLISVMALVLVVFYISLFMGGDMLSSLLSNETNLILFGSIALVIDLGTQINLGIKEIRTCNEFDQLSQQFNNVGSQAEEFSKMGKFLKIGAILEMVEHGIIALLGIFYGSLLNVDMNTGYGAIMFVLLVAVIVVLLEIVGKIMHVITWMKFSSWFDSTSNEFQHQKTELQGKKPSSDMLKIGYIVHAGGYVAIIGLYMISWLIILIGNIIFTISLGKMGIFLQTSGNVLEGEGQFYSSARNVQQVDSFSGTQQTPATYNMDGTGMGIKDKFCSFCGAGIGGDNLKFCPNCGHVIQD